MAEKRNLFNYLEASAAARPRASAVEQGGNRLTYAELLEQSRRLAATLCSQGLGPSDRVGLLLDKSIEAVVGLHGILAAGAAYVPLDARQPAERLALILQDCGIEAVISRSNELGRYTGSQALSGVRTALILGDSPGPPPGTEVRRALEDRGTEVLPALADSALDAPCPSGDRDLAYVLYTSGSTGQPKGVTLSHYAAMAFVDWAVADLGLRSDDRLASQAAFTFDLSILDLFGSTAAGATLCLMPDEVSLLPRALGEWIETNCITVLYSVPWVFIKLLTMGTPEERNYEALRLALFAGEVFPVKHLSALMRAWPQTVFHNLFGPTETNVCTAYRVPAPPDPDGDPVPIGRPASGDTCWVLGPDGRLLSDTEEGELIVAGPSLLTGYWGDEQRTARSFIDLSPHGGPERAYCTGDRVARRPDGNYLYLGRMDRMLKRRGYRIEPGEVEAALVAHPELEEAAVAAEAGSETARIRAFAVAAAGSQPGLLELKSFLSGRLPRYMIPDTIELVDRFPRTRTGKIDRRRLLER